MRYVPVLAALLLAGCASLDADLKTADAQCAAGAAMTAFVTCLNQNEEPVWRKDAPDAVADYQTFAAARMALAADLDSGKITPAQFQAGAAQARTDFQKRLAANANAVREAKARRVEEDMEQAVQRFPQAGLEGGGRGMSMGGESMGGM